MITPADKADLIGRMRDFREQLYAVLERLSDAQATQPQFTAAGGGTGAGSSVKEEIAILAGVEAMYRAWVESVRSTDLLDLHREPDPEIAAPAGSNALPLEDLIDGLRLERRRSMALLLELRPLDFTHAVRTAHGGVTVDEIFGALARHDRDLTVAILARSAEHLPEFLAGRRPRRPLA